jgi:hypothetical protein
MEAKSILAKASRRGLLFNSGRNKDYSLAPSVAIPVMANNPSLKVNPQIQAHNEVFDLPG